MKKKQIIKLLIVLAGFTAVALILSIQLGLNQSFRLVFGSLLIIFIPGFLLSWIIWKKNKVSNLERFVISIALSIAIVPSIIFLLNKAGILFSLWNVFFIVLGIIIIEVVILTYRNKKITKENK